MTAAAPVTEKQLLAAVLQLAALLGIYAYHTHDSRHSEPGFPDLVLAGCHGAVFAELKTDTGRLTEQQREWGRRLKNAGCDWHLWRPDDLLSGAIATVMKGIM